jgi:Zn-finger nucleic acid-binding protein
MADRQGVEIDYCPQCRGVWLDRGELDKIIERSASLSGDRYDDDRPREPRPEYREPRPEYREHRSGERYDDDYYRKKKKKGFLGELFDFD